MRILRIARRVVGLLILGASSACAPREPEKATYVGAARCAECHAAEDSAWRSSQHAVAMQVARPGTVLGRFAGDSLVHGDLTTTFARRGDRFVVRTEDDRGTIRDLDVRYTFGVFPLQQYLIGFPGGRLQPLPYAWDARPAAAGGQRWFALDPLPRPHPSDETHWAGRYANWNHMCADCHSTAVRKGYDAASDTFRTTYAEVDVACEACHGPASRHVAWASRPRWWRAFAGDPVPLPARLDERRGVQWLKDTSGRGIARSTPRRTDREIEVCAQCHARREHFADGYEAGAPYFDFYSPMLLLPGLYHADGQQRAEVFGYGSFLQSRMYAAGVTCSDCHEPHSQKLRRPGNAVCTQCHGAARYDGSAHTFHRTGGAGSTCVGCHMPDTTYMGIDRRHDHSLRIPRPDLSVRLGVPNACNRCHTDRDARWVEERVRAWYGHTPAGFQRFAGAFAADERGDAGAEDSLATVARDATQPMIARASALARLAHHPGDAAQEAALRGLRDPHPLVRRAAMEIVGAWPPSARVGATAPLLSDSTRVVRQQAAWLLAPVADSLPTEVRRRFDRAAAELVASHRYNADRATSRLTLGAFYLMRGQLEDAAGESRAAIRLAPYDPQGYVNLAGVRVAQGRIADAEATLREGRARVPDDEELARLHAATLTALKDSARGGSGH